MRTASHEEDPNPLAVLMNSYSAGAATLAKLTASSLAPKTTIQDLMCFAGSAMMLSGEREAQKWILHVRVNKLRLKIYNATIDVCDVGDLRTDDAPKTVRESRGRTAVRDRKRVSTFPQQVSTEFSATSSTTAPS